MLTNSFNHRAARLKYVLLMPFAGLVFGLSACGDNQFEAAPMPPPPPPPVEMPVEEAAIVMDPDVKEYIAVDVSPEPLNLNEVKREIGYPKAARENGVEGMVVVRILVGTDGIYQKHIVINSANPILDEVVEAHLTKIRFKPAEKDGKAVKFWVNIPFNFKLVE